MDDFDATLYATMRPARSGKSLVTLSTYQERQETLNRTSMMEDDSSHRTSRNFPNEKSSITDTTESQQRAHQQNIPPPPPQFANSPPKNQINNIYGMQYPTVKRVNSTIPAATSINNIPNMNALKPPNSPTPDYDNVDFRKRRQLQTNDANASNNKSTPSTSSAGNPSNINRRTMRLGAVTIGEYEPQRKEPSKFEFVGNKGRDTSNGYNSRNVENLHSELHDTLTRSKLKSTNQIEHQRDCPLRNGSAVDQLTRKIQGANLNQKQAQSNEGTATIKRQNGSTPNGTGTSTGILKNGNSRNSSSNSNGNGINGHNAKMIEKTITFGN